MHDASVQIGLALRVLAVEERTIPIAVERVTRALRSGESLTLDEETIWIHVPRRLQFRGGRAWLEGETPKQARISRPLAKALKRAHQILDGHLDDEGQLQKQPVSPHERDLIRLSFLAPNVQSGFLEGRQKLGLCLDDLRGQPIPLCWADQTATLIA